jgi:AraC family transcriptional regulator, transcriptional activator of pobA
MAGSRQHLYDSNIVQRTGRIRSYSLFGESAQLPDVMHCETIEARSVVHDWELAPHRHGRLHQVLLLQAGRGTAQLEGRTVALAPMALVNVPPGNVHGFSFEPGTQGYVATLADEMLAEILAQAADVRRALARACVVAADAEIAALMQQIAREFDGRAPARALVLRGLCTTLLARVARSAGGPDPVGADLAESHLLARFEALVEAHFAERWGVADYARALAVTPTHLSRVTRAATGDPASRLIEERLVREARRHLAYTNLPVTAIAYGLGFADPAHFSRVFARATGVAPRRFRERLARPADPS